MADKLVSLPSHFLGMVANATADAAWKSKDEGFLSTAADQFEAVWKLWDASGTDGAIALAAHAYGCMIECRDLAAEQFQAKVYADCVDTLA